MQTENYMSEKEDVPTSLHLFDFHKSPTKLHCTTVRSIHALDHAVAPVERRAALNLAVRTFSHNNANLHDFEMSLGVDKSLCSKLGYIASKRPLSEDEVTLICKCLCQVFQCSVEYRKRSFRSIGASELFPLLAQIWNHLISSMGQLMFQDSDSGSVMQQLLQVFRIFAKLEIAIPCLIYFDEGKFLSSVILGIHTYLSEALGSTGQVILIEMLGLMKDLTFRASISERIDLINLEGGSLIQVLFMCSRRKAMTTPKITEMITAIIWNLALEGNTRDALLFREGRHTSVVIDFLFAILSKSVAEENNKDSTTILRSKRNAISAIGNIFSDDQNHKFLCCSGNAKDSGSALQALISQVNDGCDSVVRRRAMRTIRCLAQSKNPETRKVLKEKEVVSFLVSSISRNVSQDDENDRDMQLQAFYAVGSMTDTFSETDWPFVETTILQRIETTTDAKLINGACKSLVECISRSPWKRGSSCFSEIFWMRLESAVSASKDCHSSVSMLILSLAEMENEKRDQETTQKSDLVATSVLHCLTLLLDATGNEYEKSRNNALDSIMVLVENEANKRCMAENEDLLSGLVNLCLLQPEQSRRAKELLLQLVPEL